jgi:hypothetical protein
MNINQPGDHIVSDLYENYSETQKEILAIEIRKTRIKLFTIAGVIFLFDFLAIYMANTFTLPVFLWILIFPVIIAGLAFLATKEPLTAMIICAVIIIGLWLYAIITTGGRAALTGWFGKALIIYLIFAGFQNAREANRIKNELQGTA